MAQKFKLNESTQKKSFTSEKNRTRVGYPKKHLSYAKTRKNTNTRDWSYYKGIDSDWNYYKGINSCNHKFNMCFTKIQFYITNHHVHRILSPKEQFHVSPNKCFKTLLSSKSNVILQIRSPH